ncbi:MAG: choice-of-anchor Q domain-containing protein, partial [Xanthobacteraceae bacterium]
MLVPLWVLLLPSLLHASTITVNTTADPGTFKKCSLRAAITNANSGTSSPSSACAAGTGNDTIVFGVSGTITLGSSLPAIENTLTIDGSGKTITVSGAGLYQVLVVNLDATLTLNDLTIAHGNWSSDGGGINNQGTLTVTNSTFSDNSGGDGGGVFNAATLTVTNSTFELNSAHLGGGIFNNGGASLTVTSSTFSGDNATGGLGSGGGMYNEGTAMVVNSTFAGNDAANGFGGGIYNSNNGAVLTITNCTFSRNGPAASGGGIYNEIGTVRVTNSILAKSTSGGNCGGVSVTDGGYNISDDDTCGFFAYVAANGDTIGDGVTDAHLALGVLANNGGPTKTIALGSRSYAIDAVLTTTGSCPLTDQRGAPRPDPGDTSPLACDIGAFESGNLVWLEPPTLDFGTIAIGQSSLPSAVTLNNRSGKTLTKITSSIGPDYKVVSYTCSSALATGKSCSFLISFRPQNTVTTPETFSVFDS